MSNLQQRPCRRPPLSLTGRALPALALPALAVAAVLGLSPLQGPAPLRAAASQEPEQAIRATYLCRGRFDALELTALFFNREPAEVVLLQGETATRLPQQLSASGSRYGSGSHEFWIKGEAARWRLGPHPAAVMQCQAQPVQSQR